MHFLIELYIAITSTYYNNYCSSIHCIHHPSPKIIVYITINKSWDHFLKNHKKEKYSELTHNYLFTILWICIELYRAFIAAEKLHKNALVIGQ